MLIYRYECPAGCLDATGKVVGTVYYEMVSTQVDANHFLQWSVLCQLTAVYSVKCVPGILLNGVSARVMQIISYANVAHFLLFFFSSNPVCAELAYMLVS